jgi:hypothetical protein
MKICCRMELCGLERRYRLKGFTLVGMPVFCCERMANEWGRLIDFALRGFARPENLCCCLSTHHLLSDTTIVSALEPISHCPWCGEAIELVQQHRALSDAGVPEGF